MFDSTVATAQVDIKCEETLVQVIWPLKNQKHVSLKMFSIRVPVALYRSHMLD